MARLIFRADTGQDSELRIDQDHPQVVIGRSKTCDIRTRNNTVSRQHAKVTWENGAYHLVDLGSSNGTFYDAQRIAEHWLEDGDLFTCGAFQIRFILEDYERQPAPPAEFDYGQDEFGQAQYGESDYPPDPYAQPPAYAAAEPAYQDGAEDSAQYPMAAEVASDDEGIAFGEPEPERPTDAAPDAYAAAAWNDFSLEPSAPEAAARGAVPVTHLPFEPPQIDDGLEPIDAVPFDLPPPPPATVIPDADLEPVSAEPQTTKNAPEEPLGRFEEFNRQLELKDQQLADARDHVRTLEEDNLLLQTEVDALRSTVEEHSRLGASTQEITDLQAANERLTESLTTAEAAVEERDERLRSLEGQILRIQENQPSAKELEALYEARDERDRLWDDRERLETDLLNLKRQLAGGQADLDPDLVEAGDLALDLRTQLEESQASLTDVRDALRSTESQLDDAERARDEATAETSRLKTRLVEAEDEAARFANRLDELEQSLETARSDASGLQSVRDELATMATERDELRRQLDAAAAERDQFSSAATERDALQASLDSTAAELSEAREAITKLQATSDEATTVRAALDEVTAERGALASKCETLGSELSEVRTALARLESENSELKTMIGGLPQPETVARLERELADAQRNADRLEGDLADRAALEGKVSEASAALASANADAASLRAKVEELEELLVHAPSASQHEALQTRLKKADADLAAERERVTDTKARVKALEEQLEIERTGSAARTSERDELQSALDRLQKDSDSASADLTSLRASLQTAEAEVLQLKNELKQTSSRVATLEPLEAVAARVPDLEADLASRDETISTLKSDLEKTRSGADRADRLGEQVEGLREELEAVAEERDDLLVANKGQVKRVSSLLKQVDELKAKVSKLRQSDAASDQAARKLGEVQAAHDRLAERVKRLEGELSAAESERDAAKQAATKAERAVTDQSSEIRSAQKAKTAAEAQIASLEQRIQELESSTSAPSPAGAPEDLLRGIEGLLEEVNDRISAFRNNCETVQYCLEDIVAGRDPADNQAAAAEMLTDNGSEVDALKKAMRRFKSDYLKRGR